jgi:predicted small metal-binding protein
MRPFPCLPVSSTSGSRPLIPDRPHEESAVMISTRCKGCDLELTAPDEDELVGVVQAHVADVHAAGHTPSRADVLAVIRAQDARDS